VLYGDTEQELLILSIIDQLSTSASFGQAIEEFFKASTSPGYKSSRFSRIQNAFEALSTMDVRNSDRQNNTIWLLTINTLRYVKDVLKFFIENQKTA
jgi:hypothetical protein